MNFSLPPLPYAMNALEPLISKSTLEFHYGKHHQAYVNNLNALVPGTPFEDADLNEIVMKSDGGIFNNAAQVWNHTFYWNCLSPDGGTLHKGDLSKAIDKDFGTFDQFKEQFTKAAASLFGSGWAWLAKDEDGKLHISQESNAGNPMRKGLHPILTCDVWEHAYYVDKQNRRPDYIADFWKLVNWDFVEANYQM